MNKYLMKKLSATAIVFSIAVPAHADIFKDILRGVAAGGCSALAIGATGNPVAGAAAGGACAGAVK